MFRTHSIIGGARKNHKLERPHQKQRQAYGYGKHDRVVQHPAGAHQMLEHQQHDNSNIFVTAETHQVPQRRVCGAIEQVEADLEKQNIQEGTCKRL